MRRKNRQIKLMVDIPPKFADEEEFMEAFMDRLDDVNWKMSVDGTNLHITRAELGDIMIEPEEE